MSMNIDPEKIATGEGLTEQEFKYLHDRLMLPWQKDPSKPKTTPLEEQSVATIGEPGGIDDEGEEDYEGWTNKQLRAKLAENDLTVAGKQDELVARLRRMDADELTDEDRQTPG